MIWWLPSPNPNDGDDDDTRLKHNTVDDDVPDENVGVDNRLMSYDHCYYCCRCCYC